MWYIQTKYLFGDSCFNGPCDFTNDKTALGVFLLFRAFFTMVWMAYQIKIAKIFTAPIKSLLKIYIICHCPMNFLLDKEKYSAYLVCRILR